MGGPFHFCLRSALCETYGRRASVLAVYNRPQQTETTGPGALLYGPRAMCWEYSGVCLQLYVRGHIGVTGLKHCLTHFQQQNHLTITCVADCPGAADKPVAACRHVRTFCSQLRAFGRNRTRGCHGRVVYPSGDIGRFVVSSCNNVQFTDHA